MKSFKRFTAIMTLSVLSVAAAPAVASGGIHHGLMTVPAAETSSSIGSAASACNRDPAQTRCGHEQSRLLEAVEKMARTIKSDVSQRDIGRRQLDALIASVN